MPWSPDPQPDSLHIEIDLGLPQLGDYNAIARAWLTDAPARLAAHQVAAALATSATEKSLSRHVGAFGAPGTPWGSVIHAPYCRPRTRSASLYAFTERTYAKFLAKLAAEIPERAELKFSELDKHGHMGGGDYIAFYVHLDGPDIDRGKPSAVRLIADLPMRRPELRVPDDLADHWASFMDSFLQTLGLPVVYGHVANDMPEDVVRTSFEMATGGWPFRTDDHRELRGYSWITVITHDQASRLGGPDSLRASGAFFRVTELSSRSVVLRATARLSEYTGSAIERVWEVLRPVLPHGVVPDPPPAFMREARLVFKDAAVD